MTGCACTAVCHGGGMERSLPSGVRLVIRGGSPLEPDSWGFADAGAGVPWSVDVPSQIASISKQLVAVLTLLLVDDGVLRLDTTVPALLPNAARSWQDVTLVQLLTHTSGMAHWGERAGFDPAAGFDPSERLALLLEAPLTSPPGATWRYSSPGYIVLSAALEAATERRYGDLAREGILEPLGLTGTTIGTPPSGPRAHGTRQGQPVASWDLSTMSGTGDIWSTARDVATFVAAVHDGSLLPAAAQRLLHDTSVALGRPTAPAAPVITTGYALGHFVGAVSGHPARLHPGDNPGYQALAAWLPSTGTTIVVLSNDEADDVESLLVQAISPDNP